MGNRSDECVRVPQSALVFWLDEGVDGIQLSGVERVATVVPSLWNDIRAIVQNRTDKHPNSRWGKQCAWMSPSTSRDFMKQEMAAAGNLQLYPRLCFCVLSLRLHLKFVKVFTMQVSLYFTKPLGCYSNIADATAQHFMWQTPAHESSPRSRKVLFCFG